MAESANLLMAYLALEFVSLTSYILTGFLRHNRRSLEAALNPPQTDYLYFVANTEGGHFFSRTLAEHNHNVALYRRRLAAQHGAAAANDSTSPPQPAAIPSSSPAKLRLR